MLNPDLCDFGGYHFNSFCFLIFYTMIKRSDMDFILLQNIKQQKEENKGIERNNIFCLKYSYFDDWLLFITTVGFLFYWNTAMKSKCLLIFRINSFGKIRFDS